VKATIVAYCMQWHLTRSNAFHEILVKPLRPYTTINLVNGEDNPTYPLNGSPLIFCQLLPPAELLSNPKARLVWIPMWDNVKHYPQTWWNSLPASLRVVAFSEAVASKAQAAGLPTLRLRFYRDPSAISPVTWERGRILLYWNRTGMIGPKFLENFCAQLKIDKLLFRPEIDPGIAARFQYHLPRRLGETEVEEIPGFLPYDEYLQRLSNVNVFLAPRPAEGVGVTFLDALAQGSAVFAFDAPTMNEYITSGEDGFLLRRHMRITGHMFIDRVLRYAAKRLRSTLGFALPQPVNYPVTEHQDWQAIRALDLKKLGSTARLRQEIGFKKWQDSQSQYAQFVLDW
jgi:hypothetical protein